jgi:hypothetical protein
MLSVIYAACHKSHYSECRFAECLGPKNFPITNALAYFAAESVAETFYNTYPRHGSTLLVNRDLCYKSFVWH